MRLLILAGGRSAEHQISLMSAQSVVRALDSTEIKATVLVITQEGRWLSDTESTQALQAGQAPRGGVLTLQRAPMLQQFDVVFPLLHGPFGEDGTIQGLLESADLPYVGSGVLASAVCMDKILTKHVLQSHGISQVQYRFLTRHGYHAHPHAALERIQTLQPPWFVKPANLGSSIGISKCHTLQNVQAALATAFQYDRRVLVEEGVAPLRELEVGILGNEIPQASPVGEITYASAFYDYATKYTPGQAQWHIPADIPASISQKIQELGIEAYRVLDCCGFARVDFLYQPQSHALYLSEINTIPGFTPYSMFPQLWQAAGLSYRDLIARLIKLSLDRYHNRPT